MNKRPTGIIKNLKTGNQFVVTEQHLLKVMQCKYSKKYYEVIECSEEVKEILELKELQNNPHARILGQIEQEKKVTKKEKVKK